MPYGIGLTIAGAGASIYSANKAAGAASDEGDRIDALEREKFAEAKKQAEYLRSVGDEANAVAVEQAAKADLGAQKYESLSNMAAKEVRDFAKRNEQIGETLYKRARTAGQERQAAGEQGAQAIRDASGRLYSEAQANEARLNEAVSGVRDRFTPFMDSEARSLEQLQVEMGLMPGEVNRSYRESNPAYQEYMDASRVNEEEAVRRLDQAAGNSGMLYSGRRGAELIDRYKRADNERAGIEQSYYQMYMDKLGQMANPQATQYVSNAEMGTARDIGNAYMSAAGTGINAEQSAEALRQQSMMTGSEGLELLPLMRTGGEGADIALQGLDRGTAGSPYLMAGQDYRLNAGGASVNTTMGNFPTGQGANFRMAGVEAKNAGIADVVSGAGDIYSAYMRYGQPQQQPQYYDYATMPSWRAA